MSKLKTPLTPEQVEEMKQAMQENTLKEDKIEFSDEHLVNLMNQI